MKKLLITSACALALTSAAFAQGTVNWSVLSPAAITSVTNSTVASTFGGNGTPVGTTSGNISTSTGSPLYYYALLYTSYSSGQGNTTLADPTTMSQLNAAGWTSTGLSATNSGTSAGKLGAISPSTQDAVPWANGVTNNIMLVGWSANLGNSWGAVSNVLANWNTLGSTISGLAFFGESSTGFLNPGAANPGVQVFATSSSGQGLPIDNLNMPLDELVVSTPEPGTLALAALGGASLLLFRRKK